MCDAQLHFIESSFIAAEPTHHSKQRENVASKPDPVKPPTLVKTEKQEPVNTVLKGIENLEIVRKPDTSETSSTFSCSTNKDNVVKTILHSEGCDTNVDINDSVSDDGFQTQRRSRKPTTSEPSGQPVAGENTICA